MNTNTFVSVINAAKTGTGRLSFMTVADDVYAGDVRDGGEARLDTGSLFLSNGDVVMLMSGRILNVSGDMQAQFEECSLREIDFTNSKFIPTDLSCMFQSCHNLERINLTDVDTSRVQIMFATFADCGNLKEIEFGDIDTSNITEFTGAFDGCSSIEEIDVSAFDTSKAIRMEGMFRNCPRLKKLDLSTFDTSKVYAMGRMFENCESLEELDISSFDFSRIAWDPSENPEVEYIAEEFWGITGMFEGCTNLKLVKVRTELPRIREELIKQLGDRVQFV